MLMAALDDGNSMDRRLLSQGTSSISMQVAALFASAPSPLSRSVAFSQALVNRLYSLVISMDADNVLDHETSMHISHLLGQLRIALEGRAMDADVCRRAVATAFSLLGASNGSSTASYAIEDGVDAVAVAAALDLVSGDREWLNASNV